jgi:hypothetical protein
MEALIFHELDMVASDLSKEKAGVAWGYESTFYVGFECRYRMVAKLTKS